MGLKKWSTAKNDKSKIKNVADQNSEASVRVWSANCEQVSESATNTELKKLSKTLPLIDLKRKMPEWLSHMIRMDQTGSLKEIRVPRG
jgi:hypothetical protein